MADPLVKVIVDCSVPDRDAAVAYTQDQIEAVMKQRSDGNITSEQAAESLVALADLAAEAAGIPDRVTIVALDADELADHADRQTQAAVDAAAQEKAQTTRDALVTKLAAGQASPQETQQALATLLGGPTAADEAAPAPATPKTP
jgi:hypothetical protein